MSVALTRPCRLCSTAVQSSQEMFHDALPFLPVVHLPQIEDLTDAHRIDSFVTNDVANFFAQINHGMASFFRAYLPADVVEC